MKEQGKNPPDQTNEEEIRSLPEREFRVMIVKMIQILGNRTEKIQEMFNKDLEELKSKQTMMNNTINEIKNTLEGINSIITDKRYRCYKDCKTKRNLYGKCRTKWNRSYGCSSWYG